MSLEENAPNTANRQRFYKLPDYWPSSPHAWFGIVEAQFRIHDVLLEEDRFTLVASVFPKSSARRVAHLLSAPPEDS